MSEKKGEITENESLTREKVRIFDVYKSLVCKQCNKSFEKKTAFQAHVKSHEFDDHTYESKKKPLDKFRPYICNICEKKFTAKKNLLKHLRVIHKNLNEAEKLKVKKTRCPELNCLFACRKMRDLRLHIEKHHEIKILKDTLQFTDEAAFLKWKKEEEDNSVASFVAFRRKGMLRNGTIKKVLLCHRTGQYSPKGTGKHRLKSHGSCKIGGTCPAAMEMIQGPDGQITVFYYKTHLGHSQDVIHLQLSREDRAKLSERIKQGFSLDAILEDVKESIEPGTGKTKRIHLLSRKDLYNIMQSNNCKKTKQDLETDVDNLLLKDEACKAGNDVHEKQTIFEISEKNEAADKNYQAGRNDDINESTDTINHDIIQTLSTDGVFFHNETVTQVPACNETPSKTTPQLVIVSPDVGYRSVAEVILLQPNENLTNHVAKSAQVVPMTKPKILPKGKDFSPQGKPKKCDKKASATIQSPLTLKLHEKIEKLRQILPKAEFLTPKQYETISGKLDSIISVLNSVNVRPKSKKLSLKKIEEKKDEMETQEGSENVGIECLLATPQNVVQQQSQENRPYPFKGRSKLGRSDNRDRNRKKRPLGLDCPAENYIC